MKQTRFIVGDSKCCPTCNRPWDQEDKPKRINWKNYFGKSFMEICGEMYAKGKTQDETYVQLRSKLIKKGVDDQEMFRLLEKNVQSRFSEVKKGNRVVNSTRMIKRSR